MTPIRVLIEEEMTRVENTSTTLRDDPGDLRGASPTQLKAFDGARLRRIAEMEETIKRQNAVIQDLRAQLRQWEAIDNEIKRRGTGSFLELRQKIIAQGETPWIASAKRGRSLP